MERETGEGVEENVIYDSYSSVHHPYTDNLNNLASHHKLVW